MAPIFASHLPNSLAICVCLFHKGTEIFACFFDLIGDSSFFNLIRHVQFLLFSYLLPNFH